MHYHRPEDPASVILNVTECLPLVTAIRETFLKFTRAAKQVQQDEDANLLVGRVDATLQVVQTQVMTLLKQACQNAGGLQAYSSCAD